MFCNQVIFAYMITVSIENEILRKTVLDALCLAFGDENVSDQASREDVRLLVEALDDRLSIRNAEKSVIGDILLPLKPSDFVQKCRTYLKLETVPKLEKDITIQGFVFKPIDFLLVSQNDDQRILLTEKERNILLFLADRDKGAVKKDDLLHEIWNYAPDLETHTLETHIYRLRQKIEGDPTNPKILITENDGYRLLLD